MDAAESSPLRSKKQPAPSDRKIRRSSDPDQWGVKTPGKASDPLRRRTAMSIKDVREAAMKLRQRGSDPIARVESAIGSELGPVAKPKKSMKLPEKYELLDKFFNSLDSSIRLLQLKRSATTFTNISPQIESLTDRRFTCGHLAQLKFIMPEAIVVEKVMRHDERTSCMKPDIRITLNVEAIQSESKLKSLSRNLQLRKVFRGRLLEFFKSHPEGDEVPEETLPEPFGRMKEDASVNSVQPSASTSISPTPNPPAFERQPITGSHLSSSFKPRFTLRGPGHHLENLKQDQSVAVDSDDKFSASPSGKEISAIATNSHFKLPLKPSDSEKCTLKAASSSTLSSPPETPLKCVNSINDDHALRTPVYLASTPAKLMTATPSLHPPKRCYMSPDDNSCRSPSKLVRRPPPNRPLKFDTPVKSARSENSSMGDDILDLLPQGLIQSIQEKERLAAMERDPLISQAKWRSKMIASLPKRFDMIYFLFQSIRRSVVTKEELIQKIINGDLEVTDKREVEEQIRLLQELAPEWIHEKSMSSGDHLICVNKITSPETIRTRLSEAK